MTPKQRGPNIAAARAETEDVPMPDRDAPKGGDKNAPKKDTDRGAPAVDSDDENDEIVAECDVYLNHMQDPTVFQGDFYMLQYPHRPAYRPYGDQGRLRHVDLEKNQQRLRLAYKLDTEATHYNKNARALKKEHVLVSTGCNNPNVSYCIAAIHDGKMCMTPLRSFLQCRAQLEDDESDDDVDAAKDIFGQTEIKMNFSKPRKHAVATVEKSVWDELEPFDVHTKETECAYEHFFRVKDEEVEFKNKNTENLFMERMCGTEMTDALDTGTSFLSKYVLSRMTIAEQVQAILWEAESALSYTEIRKRVSSQEKNGLSAKIFEVLHRSCICAKNMWVLQHELLGFSDWAAEARESLLLALNKTGSMMMSRYALIFKNVLSKEMLLDIAKTVGVIDKAENEEDRIILPETTDDLAVLFPQEAQKVSQYWSIKEAVVRETLTKVRNAEPLAAAKVTEIQDNRLRCRLQHEVRVLLLTAARTVADLQRPVQAKHPNNNVSDTLLKSVLSKATLKAGTIRNVWFLQNVEGRLNPYRQCAIALFKENSSATGDDFLELSKKAGLENPTDLELRQLLGEFAVYDGDRWTFRE